jgi:hypothetical protein
MPDHDPGRLRVRKADAERLLARTLAVTTLTFQRMEECRQRAMTAAVLAQQSRSRMRTAMWLAHSRG